ncbi:hypothetical protein PGTUg99_015058 [Puccinia graminis f. sp. tritici]|uniref:Uncharacterized protein n=1 Tax=Puccinia graminis f. sp. tritici TaxID=56615 RepID=A0A5B0Q4E8_PUCGR|nr:hypothetical protein PGTUg99_015058 [Puccinia graminis f. sp. tritici]
MTVLSRPLRLKASKLYYTQASGGRRMPTSLPAASRLNRPSSAHLPISRRGFDDKEDKPPFSPPHPLKHSLTAGWLSSISNPSNQVLRALIDPPRPLSFSKIHLDSGAFSLLKAAQPQFRASSDMGLLSDMFLAVAGRT